MVTLIFELLTTKVYANNNSNDNRKCHKCGRNVRKGMSNSRHKHTSTLPTFLPHNVACEHVNLSSCWSVARRWVEGWHPAACVGGSELCHSNMRHWGGVMMSMVRTHITHTHSPITTQMWVCRYVCASFHFPCTVTVSL